MPSPFYPHLGQSENSPQMRRPEMPVLPATANAHQGVQRHHIEPQNLPEMEGFDGKTYVKTSSKFISNLPLPGLIFSQGTKLFSRDQATVDALFSVGFECNSQNR